MKTAKFSLIVLVVAGSTLSSYAQKETQRLSKVAHEARRAESLALFDVDGDEVLSKEERQALHEYRSANRGPRGDKGRVAEFLAKFDMDGDGTLSEEECAYARDERKAQVLGEFDVDNDWELSPEERQAACDACMERGGVVNREGQGRAKRLKGRLADIIPKFDIDGDGVFSKAERAAMKAYVQAKKAEC